MTVRGRQEGSPTPRGQRPVELLVLPLIAVGLLAFAALTHVPPRTARYALLVGGPTDGEFFHGRLGLVEESAGVRRSVAAERVELRCSATKQEAHFWTTGPDGWAEVELELSGREPKRNLRFAAVARDGEPLGAGDAEVSRTRWAAAARRAGRKNLGLQESGGKLSLTLSPPLLSPPFDATMEVHALREEGLSIKMDSDDLEWLESFPDQLGGDSRASARLRALGQAPRLRVSLGSDGQHFSLRLPILMGSYTMRREREGWRILSPAPRDEVYFAVQTREARGIGGRLELRRRSDGTASAWLADEALGETRASFLALSSSPDLASPALVGLPLDGQGETFAVPDVLLLSGRDAALRRERSRQRRVRIVLGSYAALAGLLTIGLFLRRVRQAQARLERDLSAAGATAATSDKSLSWLSMAVISLFFAFSLAVLWIVAR